MRPSYFHQGRNRAGIHETTVYSCTRPSRAFESKSEDAKTVVLSHLRDAITELMKSSDYDAILAVIVMMKRIHDGEQ